MKKLSLSFLIWCFSTLAFSWDGVVEGVINVVDVVPVNGENFGFRVSFESNQPLCGNEHTWAFINQSDPNYDATVAVLLAAKMSGSKVVLYSDQRTSNNYCHIGYVSLR